ncbi:MAG: hypothetical protein JO232_17235, partial [Verrucomicrobia bacterium]|nr:hypothetical protein [Verrucomicrobiota bacterium]
NRLSREPLGECFGLPPHAGLLALFFIAVILDAGTGIVNPLLYREIINNGILKGDTNLVVRLAVLAAIFGILDAALGLAQSYLSAKVSAGVVGRSSDSASHRMLAERPRHPGR